MDGQITGQAKGRTFTMRQNRDTASNVLSCTTLGIKKTQIPTLNKITN